MAAATATAWSGGFGFGLGGGFGGLGLAFRRRWNFLFVIGFVETGAFENHAGTGTDQAVQFLFTAFWTFGQLGIGHGLQFFERMAAGGAFVFVRWHISPYLKAFLNLSFNEPLPVSPDSLANSSISWRWRLFKFSGTLIITRTYKSP